MELPLALVAECGELIGRQEQKYGAADATVKGVRLMLAALEDETGETLGAWRLDRVESRKSQDDLPLGDRILYWDQTREELLQVACVALRTVVAIDNANPRL